MRAEKVVAFLLTTNPAVTALVGSAVYGGVAPERSSAPAVIYSKLGADRERTIEGDIAKVNAQIEVLYVAATYEQLKAMGEAGRLAVAYQQGSIAGVDVVLTEVIEEGPDTYDPNDKVFAQAWAFSIVHTE